MSPDEHDRLEEWAKKYAVLALLGYISVLLMIGKGVHYLLLYRGYVCRIGVVPSALLSGLLGLFWMYFMEIIDPTLTYDLNYGLNSLKIVMVNFTFASLTLGLFCSRSTTQHSNIKAIFLSILHEGIPMVIYSQILIWGQSCICLLLYCLFYLNSPNVPHLVSAMVPLGIEAGSDVLPTAVYENAWSQTVVQEAESLGLFAACFLGVVAVSVKNRYIRGPWNQDNSHRNEFYVRNHSGSAEFEAFGRQGDPTGTPITPSKQRRASTASLSQRANATSSSSNQLNKPPSILIPEKSPSLNPTPQSPSSHLPSPSSHPLFIPYKSSNVNSSTPHSSLGTHLSVIFLAVFFAFNFGLFSRLFETQSQWLKAHRIISSIRMFEMSIICSFFLIHFFLSYTTLTFKSEWFMRLCGLTLDMVLIASLTSALPRPDQMEQVNYSLVSVFVLACSFWNVIVFAFFARKMFPNFWYERGITLTAEALGHSSTGLLFARVLDPSMNTPVPYAYACKLMLFAIFPSSGGKNTIVVSLVDSHGPWFALLVCCCVVIAWGFVFEKYIRGKYIQNSSSPKAPEEELERERGLGGGHGNGGISMTLTRSKSESEIFHENPNQMSSSYDRYEYPQTQTGRVTWMSNSVKDSQQILTDGTNLQERFHEIISQNASHPTTGLSVEEVLEFDEESRLLQNSEKIDSTAAPLLSSSNSQNRTSKLPPTSHGTTIPSSLPAFRMNSVSGMLSPAHFTTIMSWILPEYQHSLIQLSLLYTLQRDGASLATLLSLSCPHSQHTQSPHEINSFLPHDSHHHSHPHHSSAHPAHLPPSFSPSQQQILLLIEDSWGYIFGVYLSHPLKISSVYYGNGENFVFSVLPQPVQYSWTRKNDYHILSNYQQIAIGGGTEGRRGVGAGGFAIQLDDELNTGVSSWSDTYGNNILSSNEYFKCLNVEVWSIDSAIV